MSLSKKLYIFLLLLTIFFFIFSSCSINNLLSDALAGALDGDEVDGRPHPLLSENDPDLVGDALPFTLKLLDILVNANINSPPILLSAAQAYTAYAALYLQQEANTISRNDFARRSRLLDRSKIHFLRARDYALSALEMRHPGFIDLLNSDNYEQAFANMTENDVPYLYFATVSWVGAATVDVFDLELILSIPRAAEMLHTAYSIDPDYGDGAISEFYILYFSLLPVGLGGDKEKAEMHYHEAVRASNNMSVAAHLSMATGIALPAQDSEQFRSFLQKALEIDVDIDVNRRLTNIINQRSAQWYLDNIELFFIDIE